MKEIRILIQQLRNYPNNFFVYPVGSPNVLIHDEELQPHIYHAGLLICNHLGEKQGFIETGGEGEVIIQ